MKFISVSLVKNEADIIELFIRVNSRVIDHFFIVDNGSTDHTVKIIEKMKAEGYKITLYIDSTPVYQQDKMTTRAFRTAASAIQFDWAFFLDADEFVNIPKEKLEEELANIKGQDVASLKWSNWIPKGNDYYDYPNPLWSCFERKAEEEVAFVKVIIPYHLAQDTMVSVGNHEAWLMYDRSSMNISLHEGRKLTAIPLSGVLDHVPVRSADQILTKTVIGEIALSIKEKRDPHEGYHWRNNYKIIKQYGFEIDDSLVRYLGVNYLSDKGDFTDEVDPDSRLGLETDVVKYRQLYRFNYKARIFNFIQQLAETIRVNK